MPRPQCCRRIAQTPNCVFFVPVGVPACDVEEIVLSLDECEAIRLADLEGLYQEDAAARMNVSRQTLGRILETARKKVAQVLVEGKALRIGGGDVEMSAGQAFKCPDCHRSWTVPSDGSQPQGCAKCRSTKNRLDKGACQNADEVQEGAELSRKRCCHRHGRSK